MLFLIPTRYKQYKIGMKIIIFASQIFFFHNRKIIKIFYFINLNYKDKDRHPWVVLRKSGPVVNAHCDCMAGEGIYILLANIN